MDHNDIVEIEQLIAAYGHAVDAEDQSLLPLIFTHDAVFEAPFGRYEGLDEIAAWFALGKPPHPPSHHSTNIWVRSIEGKTQVRSKWFIVDRTNGQPCTGDYRDEVVRTSEGWRVSHRTCVFRYPASDEYAGRRTLPNAPRHD